mgnify:FL=1
MGFGWQELIIILVIVALIFGTKKLRGIGSDLGGAIKGFKESISSCSSESCPLHRFRPYQREKSMEGQKLPIQRLSNDPLCHESI